MSITWMIVITLLIAAEKLLPWGIPGIALVSLALAALAVGVAATPKHVPGLRIPGAHRAMSAMHMMRGSSAPMR